MNILIGFNKRNREEEFLDMLKANFDKFNLFKTENIWMAHTVEEIEEALNNTSIDVLVCREEVSNKNIGNSLMSKWKKIKPDLKIILLVNDDKAGGNKLLNLFENGYYDNVYTSHFIDGKIIAQLINESRSKEEAVEYYRLTSNNNYMAMLKNNASVSVEPEKLTNFFEEESEQSVSNNSPSENEEILQEGMVNDFKNIFPGKDNLSVNIKKDDMINNRANVSELTGIVEKSVPEKKEKTPRQRNVSTGNVAATGVKNNILSLKGQIGILLEDCSAFLLEIPDNVSKEEYLSLISVPVTFITKSEGKKSRGDAAIITEKGYIVDAYEEFDAFLVQVANEKVFEKMKDLTNRPVTVIAKRPV